LCGLALGGLVGLGLPAAAHAQEDLDAYEHATQAYDDGDYDEAVRRFEALVGGEIPRLDNPYLVLEARRLLAASYLYVDRSADAAEQFRKILEQDFDYQFPRTMAREVVQLWDRVREEERERREREARQQQEEEARRRARALERLRRAEERMLRLEELAMTETVEQRNSRLVALVPFGVGQFQNGHDVLGWTLAVSEVLLVGTAVVSFIIHQGLATAEHDEVAGDEAGFVAAEEASRLTNQISLAALAAVAIGGILDAQLRFVPSVQTTRQRTLPEDLADPPDLDEPVVEDPVQPPEPEASLRLGPLGASLRITF